MQILSIESPSRFLLPTPRRGMLAVLVGCGGTGSFLAQSLARTAAHLRALSSPPLQIVLIDGDDVDERNVGRQLFCNAEIGQNKSVTLAHRFNAAFGLQIRAIPRMATVDVLEQIRQDPTIEADWGLLIGAVDGAPGRVTLNAALREEQRARVRAFRREPHFFKGWLDCGNHQYSGQVAFGTATNLDQLHGALQLGLCTQLPSPALQSPELLQATETVATLTCAQAAAANLQSLMVNQMMAAVAGEYAYKLFVQRSLEMFRTVVNLTTLSMRSLSITPSAITGQLAEANGGETVITARQLTQETKKARGRAA